MPNYTKQCSIQFHNSEEPNFNQEDLRYNWLNDNWISRWINDSHLFGFGSGHFEDAIQFYVSDNQPKIKAGTRILLDDGWHFIIDIDGDGTEYGSVILDNNSPLSKVHAIYGTEFDNDELRICYIPANSEYTGPPVGNYLHGTGKDGDLDIHYGSHIINHFAWLKENAYGGEKIIKVDDTSNFSKNDEILIIQTQYGYWDSNYYGNFEFHYIDEIIDSTTIKLQWSLGLPFISDRPNDSQTCRPWPCPNTWYEWNGQLPSCSCSTPGNHRTCQIVRVPHYKNVRVGYYATLTTKSWDGYTGGFLIFRANDRVDINGTITVHGLGFRGGFRPPNYRFDHWHKHHRHDYYYWKPIYERWHDDSKLNYFGSSGEGCYGFGKFERDGNVRGLGGAGSCSRTRADDYYRQDLAPGSGGSFGTRGGSAFKIFREYYCSRSEHHYPYRCLEWRYRKRYLWTYPSYTICNPQLMRMTLAPGGGSTYKHHGGRGSGMIGIFTKNLNVSYSGKILATGSIGSTGRGGDYNGGAYWGDADGGHGAGGPVVLFATNILYNDGIIDGSGGSYKSGKSSRGGYGGDGRIVISTNEFRGSSPINFGSSHNPSNLKEFCRWGKLPFNLMDNLNIPYITTNTKINRADVREFRQLDSIIVNHTFPYFPGESDIRVALSFDLHTWKVWNTEQNKWLTINIQNIDSDGMSLSTLHSLTNHNYHDKELFNINVDYIDICLSLKSGIRHDSPTVSSVVFQGKKRTWTIWGIHYPHTISDVETQNVFSVIDCL